MTENVENKKNLYEINRHINSACAELNRSSLLRAKLGISSKFSTRLRECIICAEPLKIILYWGAYSKSTIDECELGLIEYIDRISKIIVTESGVEVDVSVILTDTHAKLNGAQEDTIKLYYETVTDTLHRIGWETHYLSKVAPEPPYISSLQEKLPPQYERALNLLIQDATLLHDLSHAESLAWQYLQLNIFEAAQVSRHWPRACFLHTGIPELAFMLPSLPMLYGFTSTKRDARKPWFSDVERTDQKTVEV